jgi:hypothetical protein
VPAPAEVSAAAGTLGPLQIIQGAHAMRDVPARARDVYRYLASLADNKTLSCTPSIAAIADDCDRSRSWVSAGLNELKAAGYIHITSGAQRSKVSYYRIDRRKALDLYQAFLGRRNERGQVFGWQSEKAARPRVPMGVPVQPSNADVLQDLSAEVFAPKCVGDLQGLSSEELEVVARWPDGSDTSMRLGALSILNRRFLEAIPKG